MGPPGAVSLRPCRSPVPGLLQRPRQASDVVQRMDLGLIDLQPGGTDPCLPGRQELECPQDSPLAGPPPSVDPDLLDALLWKGVRDASRDAWPRVRQDRIPFKQANGNCPDTVIMDGSNASTLLRDTLATGTTAILLRRTDFLSESSEWRR
jgi:hypothetical protein